MEQINITMKGNPVSVTGRVLKVGDSLPQFKLTANDMKDLSSADYAGKAIVVCSVPSVDTPTCSIEAKRFNDEAVKLADDIEVLVVSADLPFAQKRWCAAEGATRITTASDFKYRAFGEDFGVCLPDLGILTRAVFVANNQGKIVHVEYVKEIAEEPNYEAALAAVSNLV